MSYFAKSTTSGIWYAAALALLPLGCRAEKDGTPSGAGGAPAAALLPSATALPSATSVPSGDAAVPESDAGVASSRCSEGMLLVEGAYCPNVEQKCVEHHPEWQKDHNVSERCLRFEEPSRCLSKERVPLSFCMDRHEYPNREGELPWVLTSWRQAVKLCAAQEKRLCTEDEFNFACEGPDMLPHVYGFARDATKCNIDKPYKKRDGKMRTYEKCLSDPRCKAAFDRLDQRHASGAMPSCASWAGVHDLNGNVNEWVNLPGKEPPDRSGLKGGWWGPVRNRCRPTVTFHKEEDFGYEAGFRCCKDAT